MKHIISSLFKSAHVLALSVVNYPTFPSLAYLSYLAYLPNTTAHGYWWVMDGALLLCCQITYFRFRAFCWLPSAGSVIVNILGPEVDSSHLQDFHYSKKQITWGAKLNTGILGKLVSATLGGHYETLHHLRKRCSTGYQVALWCKSGNKGEKKAWSFPATSLEPL